MTSLNGKYLTEKLAFNSSFKLHYSEKAVKIVAVYAVAP